MQNAWILHKKSGGILSELDFRRNIVQTYSITFRKIPKRPVSTTEIPDEDSIRICTGVFCTSKRRTECKNLVLYKLFFSKKLAWNCIFFDANIYISNNNLVYPYSDIQILRNCIFKNFKNKLILFICSILIYFLSKKCKILNKVTLGINITLTLFCDSKKLQP